MGAGLFDLFKKALFITGLCLFSGTLSAAAIEADLPAGSEVPRGRTIVRSTPVPTPTPEVRREDIDALRKNVDQRFKETAGDLDDRLKAAAAANMATSERLSTMEKDMADIQASISTLSESAGDLEKGSANLSKTLKELSSVLPRLDSVETRILRQDDDVAALAEAVKAAQVQIDTDLKGVRKFQEDFGRKSDRLEGVIDLMTSMRKDINDNSRQIVELNQAIKALNNPAPVETAGSWFDRATRWPWLPAVATALGIAAVAIAAGK